MILPENLPDQISFSLLLSYITPEILWGIFGLVMLVAVIVTLILIYHWVRYNLHPVRLFFVGIIYLAGLIILISRSLFLLVSI